MSWEQAWQAQRTGWDAGEPAPALIEYLKSRGEEPPKRALVPGCGSGHDVFALAAQGDVVIGLDLAPTAARHFEALREAHQLDAARAAIVIADFFTYAPAQPFDLVWDYTFLCAIDPSRREAWGESMARLVSPGGTLLTLLFPVREPHNPEPVTDDDEGPPYRLHLEHARRVLNAHFELVSCEPPQRSHAGREGLEWLAQWTRREAGAT